MLPHKPAPHPEVQFSFMLEDPTLLAAVAVAFLFAGVVKGILGMGLPTAAIGVLSVAMAPAQAASLIILPALLTNIWQSFAGPHLQAVLRRIWTMLAGVCLGIYLSAGLLTGDTAGRAAIALGACLAVYALIGLTAARFHVPRRIEWWLSPLVGIATGVVTGATGIFVIPAVPYLQAIDLDRDELIQALGLSFMTGTAALGLVLAQAGILHAAVAGTSLLAVIPAFVGMWLGQHLRHRIPPPVFRTAFFLGMLALGLHLASRALS
jgi:uncharacterized membrane protein YfcA